ncbi:MAG: hypothetical protein ACI9OJ_000548 [Myxococcota bacterium]|jgi:hypothetical protein
MMMTGDSAIRQVRTFRGRNRVAAKREVLSFWHTNHGELGLSLKEFLAQCRMSDSGRVVVFRY